MKSAPGEVTHLLLQLKRGDKEAEGNLIPLVYNELRRIAAIHLRREAPNHSFQPTALVHEAYIRLIGIKEVDWQSRSHFFAVSARLLRRILVDHAKASRRQKRGGGAEVIPLDEAVMVGPDSPAGLLELDSALERLSAQDQRKSEIVELLCFGGLTYDETAAALKISPATVHREIKLAKAWLHRELARGAA